MAPASVHQLPTASRESPKVGSAASPDPCLTAAIKAVPNRPAQGKLALSQEFTEFVAQYRSFGSEVWKERRRLFKRLFAAAQVAQEHNENPKDAELYAELWRLGQQFGLFN